VLVPEPAVALDPLGGAAKRRAHEAAPAHAAVALDPGQSRSLQDANVLGDRGEGDREVAGQLADRGLAAGEAGEDGAAGRVGERGEGPVERRL